MKKIICGSFVSILKYHLFYRWKAINLFLQSRNQRSIWLNSAALCETSHFLLTGACLINMSYAGFELHCFTFRFSAFYVDAIILFTHTFHRVWSSRRKKKANNYINNTNNKNRLLTEIQTRQIESSHSGQSRSAGNRACADAIATILSMHIFWLDYGIGRGLKMKL